jgi:transcriptional regulator with XRE-family HTH domain
LANQAEVSSVAIYNIENGKIRNPQASTREKLASVLKAETPKEVIEETESEQAVKGLGILTDFPPHSKGEWPQLSGVYVLYDISYRPIYVGKASNIAGRLASHNDKFWFRFPIVAYASYIQVADENLGHQLEQAMIKFLKTNAVVNQKGVQRPDDDK